MTVTLEQAASAARNLTHPHPKRRAEAQQTVRTYLDEVMERKLQEAFDLPSAPGSPMEVPHTCEKCNGLGYYGRWSHDPQLNERDECDECEGTGRIPPFEEPSA